MKIELTKEILKNLIMLDECCENLICLIADEAEANIKAQKSVKGSSSGERE